ncbi:helix-turn-helix domain-containing protein [Enterococcus sp. BWR-S5]|uniref:helix-turn-helix domain-containing protein n=1 Tax=Enterococcus sp. BWR-S5 TaxID=2787714 RepID=UPI0019213E93|nr:helix-turn-helix transcriptional regulator [Enterococcus sp. BWR-S5]MBL1224222.1 helix-turn-helix transcriptional regulator [Enterococcus sp. BWR-S5]
MQIGEIIRFLRTHKKMSQSEVAAYLDVRVMNISNWERGISQPPAEKIKEFSQLFQVSIDTLFGRTTLESFTNQNIYEIRDLALELQTVMNDLKKEDIDRIFRFVYDLKIMNLRKQFNYDAFEVESSIKLLLQQSNNAVYELAKYCKRLVDEFGAIHGNNQKQLLFDSVLLVELKQENTPEFKNVQRGIYEELLPLDLFIIAWRKGDTSLKEMAERFNVSYEFVLEATAYYKTAQGDTCSVNDYFINFQQTLTTDWLTITEKSDVELAEPREVFPVSKLTEAILLNRAVDSYSKEAGI